MQTATQITPTPRGRAVKPENDNARREVFYFIKGNPNCSLQDLMECGFDMSASTHLSVLYFNGKITRTTARVSRPHRGNGTCERDVFVYTTAVSEYDDIPTVVPNLAAKKKRVHKKIRQGGAAQPAQGIAALPTKMVEVKTKEQEQREYIAMVDAQAKPIPANITAEYVIKHISLSEAVKLHAELKKMLG
jgi:hypothetical protein